MRATSTPYPVAIWRSSQTLIQSDRYTVRRWPRCSSLYRIYINMVSRLPVGGSKAVERPFQEFGLISWWIGVIRWCPQQRPTSSIQICFVHHCLPDNACIVGCNSEQIARNRRSTLLQIERVLGFSNPLHETLLHSDQSKDSSLRIESSTNCGSCWVITRLGPRHTGLKVIRSVNTFPIHKRSDIHVMLAAHVGIKQ